MRGVTDSAYARAGVDQSRSGSAVRALVEVLGTIDTGRPGRAALGSGHYANVLRLDDRRGLALSTDSVGSKVIVCEQLGRFDTIGLDLIGMNANDVICVGADPIALLDYIAVEHADPEMLEQIGIGLKEGAEQAQLEIPGGELAVLPDLIKGHPSPHGFDLVGFCVGLVDLDAIVTGAAIEPGDAIVGIPSSGIHSNGLSLARRVLPDLDERVGDTTVGELLLEPTVIYVRAIRALLESEVEVRGLAHITGEGFLNLLRLEAEVGYRIDSPLPVPRIFELIAERGPVEPAELYEVFNMGCGFCCVVPEPAAEAAVALLSKRHPGTAVIGHATSTAGAVELPQQRLSGSRAGFTSRLAGAKSGSFAVFGCLWTPKRNKSRSRGCSRWRRGSTGSVTRAQLLELGLSAQAIKYRLRRGRLHPVHRGVYAVGRPQLDATRVPSMLPFSRAGPGAALSHEHAAEVLRAAEERRGRHRGDGARRRDARPPGHPPPPPRAARDRRRRPATASASRVRSARCWIWPSRLPERELEAVVNEADRLDLVDPERLRAALAGRVARPPFATSSTATPSPSPTRSSSAASSPSPGGRVCPRR